MEAMNGECQEAIIGAFMHMHPDEIQLTKEQVRHRFHAYGLNTVNFQHQNAFERIPRGRRALSICILHHHTFFVLFTKQIKRIINLEVQSKPMYLRTLLYALRQGVALDSGERAAPTGGAGDGPQASDTGDAVASPKSAAGKVPDRLLDLYLSSQDSISLTSKVLDVYAAYVDEGEVSRTARRLLLCHRLRPNITSPATLEHGLLYTLYKRRMRSGTFALRPCGQLLPSALHGDTFALRTTRENVHT